MLWQNAPSRGQRSGSLFVDPMKKSREEISEFALYFVHMRYLCYIPLFTLAEAASLSKFELQAKNYCFGFWKMLAMVSIFDTRSVTTDNKQLMFGNTFFCL